MTTTIMSIEMTIEEAIDTMHAFYTRARARTLKYMDDEAGFEALSGRTRRRRRHGYRSAQPHGDDGSRRHRSRGALHPRDRRWPVTSPQDDLMEKLRDSLAELKARKRDDRGRAALHGLLDQAFDTVAAAGSGHPVIVFVKLAVAADMGQSHDYGRFDDLPFCRRCELASWMRSAVSCRNGGSHE